MGESCVRAATAGLSWPLPDDLSDADLEAEARDGFLVWIASTAVVMGLLSFVKLTTKNCKDQSKKARLPTL